MKRYCRLLGMLLLIVLNIVPFRDAARTDANANPCPELDYSSHSITSEPLLYLTYVPSVAIQLWYFDHEGNHRMGVDVPYPSNMNFFRVRLSPSGSQLAILFAHVEGDPAFSVADVSVAVIDLPSRQIISTHDIILDEKYIRLSARPPVVPWSSGSIVWGWLDDARLQFDLDDSRKILDLENGEETVIPLPENPWPDNQFTNEVSIYSTQYSFFMKPSELYGGGFQELAVLDIETGNIVYDDMIVQFGHVSFNEAGTGLISEIPGTMIRILQLDTGEEKYLSRRGWTEYNLDGGFIVSDDYEQIAFHTSAFPLSGDDRAYIIKQGEAFFDVYDSEFVPLCQTGTFRYDAGLPSWSSGEIYQFVMQPYLEREKFLYLYDSGRHQITQVSVDDWLSEDERLYIVGWGNLD